MGLFITLLGKGLTQEINGDGSSIWWAPRCRGLTLLCHKGPLDPTTRTRTSTRFDCPFLAKILGKFITQTVNLTKMTTTKMTTVLRFFRQNDVGLRALNVALWENLVLVVVLVLESKALYYLTKTWQAWLDVSKKSHKSKGRCRVPEHVDVDRV